MASEKGGGRLVSGGPRWSVFGLVVLTLVAAVPSNGLHLKAPWEKVNKLDGTIQTDNFIGEDRAIDVRIGNGSTAGSTSTRTPSRGRTRWPSGSVRTSRCSA